MIKKIINKLRALKNIIVKFIKKLTKKKIDIKKSWENEPSKRTDMVDFLNWFDATDSIDSTKTRATADWTKRLSNFEGYNNLNKNQSLEIGFGGGRLVMQAAKEFKIANGVDIHSNFTMTEKFLQSENCSNYNLVHRDDINNIEDNSIDMVYSFVVFQHFDTFEEVKFYLDFIKRVLKKDGVAHIFFGKAKDEQEIKEVSAKEFNTRACSLFVKPKAFYDYVEGQGFEILETEDRMRKYLDKEGIEGNESGQARVLFKKK
tara:strand:- start:1538 stop:2317 length:780 start_codon:yes stop_codon:yes gene_type:complete